MGILDWLRPSGGAAVAAAGVAAAPAGDPGALVGGLDFKSAIDAHMKWKIRLEAYINGTGDEDLRAEVVGCDDRCPLGQWIYGRGGADYGYSETFFDMKTYHAEFHRQAGAVIAAAQAGDKAGALRLLGHGDYVRASERVKKLLARLFVLVADGRTAIDAHMRWEARLREFIAGHGDSALEAETVANDRHCPLGAWLHGNGQQHYGHLPGFATVTELHRRFHRAAAAAVAASAAGYPEQALQMLDEVDYLAASDALTEALVDFCNQQVAARP